MELVRAILFVKDMARMTAFYRETLGLVLVPETAQPGWVELRAGGATLALHALPPAIADEIVVTDPPAARSETPIKLVFRVADVAAARARLEARGAVMLEPHDWGCDGLDPEGNVFQVAT